MKNSKIKITTILLAVLRIIVISIHIKIKNYLNDIGIEYIRKEILDGLISNNIKGSLDLFEHVRY